MRKRNKVIWSLLSVIMLISLSACGGSTASRNYDKAQNALIKGEYEKAAELFENISSYEDASQYSLYAKALWYGSDGKYDDALKTLAFLGDFKDSKQLSDYYSICKLSESSRIVDILDAVVQFDAISAFRDSAARAEKGRQRVYDEAVYRYGKMDYENAKWMFEELGTFKDSANRVEECDSAILESKNAKAYASAEQYVKDYEYAEAIKQYISLGDYKDSSEKSKSTFTEAVEYAKALSTEGNYEQALELLNGISNYGDVAEVRQYIRYTQAKTLMESEKYAEAYNIFSEIGGYEDSKSLAEASYASFQEQLYNKATALMKSGDYKSATQMFEEIADYSNCGELAVECTWNYLEDQSGYDSDARRYAAEFFNRNRKLYSEMSVDEIKRAVMSSSSWSFGVQTGNWYGERRKEGGTYYKVDFTDGVYKEAEDDAVARNFGYRYSTYEWYQLSEKWFAVISPGREASGPSHIWVYR